MFYVRFLVSLSPPPAGLLGGECSGFIIKVMYILLLKMGLTNDTVK